MKMQKPSQSQPGSSIRAFVDQVSEGMATLLLGEDESIKTIMPLAWLPTGAGEGIILRANFTLNPQETKSEKRQTQELLESLGDNP
jgi:hypothetical protein